MFAPLTASTVYLAENIRTGTAFAPPQITGLIFWVKSENGLFQDTAKTTAASADNDPVGAWADQSGNTNDLLQATAGSRPLLKLAIKNSRNIIRYDGVDDFLQSATFASQAQPNTVFVAGAQSATTTRTWFDGATNITHLVDNVAVSFLRTSAGSTLTTTTLVDTNWHVRTAQFNSPAGSLHRTDGTLDTLLGDAGAGALAAVTLGARGGAGNKFVGDFGEVLVYHAALTAGQMTQVERYLGTRWGITVA